MLEETYALKTSHLSLHMNSLCPFFVFHETPQKVNNAESHHPTPSNWRWRQNNTFATASVEWKGPSFISSVLIHVHIHKYWFI